jgi:hypothetical protein
VFKSAEVGKLNNDPNQQIALIDKTKKELVFVKKYHASKFFPTSALFLKNKP